MRQSEPSHVEVTSLPHALFPLFSSLSLSEKPLGRGWCCQRVLSVSLCECFTVAKHVSVSHVSRWWLLRHTHTHTHAHSYRSTIRPQRTVRMVPRSLPSSRYRAGQAKQTKGKANTSVIVSRRYARASPLHFRAHSPSPSGKSALPRLRLLLSAFHHHHRTRHQTCTCAHITIITRVTTTREGTSCPTPP